jgi:phosphatidylserine synthase
MTNQDPDEPKAYEAPSTETPADAPANIPEINPMMNEDTPRTPVTETRPRGDSWVWGIVLIILGGVFLLQNLTPFRVINWWAVFILIPAAGSFISAWRKYQQTGRFSGGVRSSLFGGLIFTTVAAIFLLNLDLGRFWPVFVIAAGLAIMVNTLLPD